MTGHKYTIQCLQEDTGHRLMTQIVTIYFHITP